MKKSNEVPLFEGSRTADREDVRRMQSQIEALGGTLHFAIRKDADGWSAVCEEAAGIVTGGRERNPGEDTVERRIREAICTAFHIRTKPAKSLFKSQVTGVALSFA